MMELQVFVDVVGQMLQVIVEDCELLVGDVFQEVVVVIYDQQGV